MSRRPVFIDWGRFIAIYGMFGAIWWEMGLQVAFLIPLAVVHLALTHWSTHRYERAMQDRYKKVSAEYAAQQRKKEGKDGTIGDKS